MLTLALALLAAPAHSQVAAPPFQGAPVRGAPAQFDYSASVTLTKDDLADAERFRAAAQGMFEAYLAHERIRGIAASIARGRFNAVVPWNYDFARTHADGLTLSFAKVTAAGEERFAQRTSFTYNGKKVDLYRYADGTKSATSVFIDGAEAKGEDGEPVRFFTKDESTYRSYVSWFEGRLGPPPAR